MKKVCRKCKDEKMLTEFVRRKNCKDGFDSLCKSCAHGLEKLWRQQNPDKKNEIRSRYRENNREVIRLQDQTNYAKNPGKFQEAVKGRMEKYLNGKGGITKEQNKILYPEKHEARKILTANIRSGKVIRPSECSSCKVKLGRIEGHHEAYTKPLEVVWLCCKCHRALHRKNTSHRERLSEKTPKGDATVRPPKETRGGETEAFFPPLNSGQ